MTNADRIRSMSNEELAAWVYDFEFHEGNCQFPQFYEEHRDKTGGCSDDCKKCLLRWLESEAE